MSDFIISLLNRHIDIANNVQPNIPAKFEPDIKSSLFINVNDPAVLHINDDNTTLQLSNKEHYFTDTPTGHSENNISGKKKDSPSQIPLNESATKMDAEVNINDTNFQRSAAMNPDKRGLKKKDRKEERAKKTPIVKSEEENSKHKILYSPKHLVSGSQEGSIKPFKFDDQDNKFRNTNHEANQDKQTDEHHSITKEQSSDFTVKPVEQETDSEKSQQSTDDLGNVDTLSHGLLGIPPRLQESKTEMNQAFFIKDSNSDSEPTIKVSIGRIEVRAVMEPVQTPPLRKVTVKPKLSLDDYLKQRDGGRR